MKSSTHKGSQHLVPEKVYLPAADNTKVLLSETAANLVAFLFENNDVANPCYCQVFDAASTASVIVGTTPATWSFMVPAGGVWGRDPQDLDILHAVNGLVVAVTSTRTGGTSPTTKPTLTLWWDRA